jgi:hypothetical protein
MESHFTLSTEPSHCVISPTHSKVQALSLFSYTAKDLTLSSLFPAPYTCSAAAAVLSPTNCPRLFPIHAAPQSSASLLSAVFILRFYLLNPLTHNNRNKHNPNLSSAWGLGARMAQWVQSLGCGYSNEELSFDSGERQETFFSPNHLEWLWGPQNLLQLVRGSYSRYGCGAAGTGVVQLVLGW